jgi:hypothetical protein
MIPGNVAHPGVVARERDGHRGARGLEHVGELGDLQARGVARHADVDVAIGRAGGAAGRIAGEQAHDRAGRSPRGAGSLASRGA